MQANIERHKTNIETFKGSIEKERASITRFQEMIATLEEDMKRPVEIVADMRAPGGPKFRNME